VIFTSTAVGTPQRYGTNNLTQLNALKQAISELKATGGGDCPELGMTGILNALSLAVPNSNVIVLTDASPKDVEKQNEVIGKATELRNPIHFFLSRDGCGNFTPYIEVANATYGLVVNRIDDFEAFAEFANKAGRFYLAVSSKRKRQLSENCIFFSASLFTTSINLLFSSVTSPIIIKTPFNEGSGEGTTLSTSGSILTYSNDHPESGVYQACSDGTFTHSVSISSSLDFFVEYFGIKYKIAVPGKIYTMQKCCKVYQMFYCVFLFNVTGTSGLVIVSTFQINKLLLNDSSRPVVLKLVSEDNEILSITKLIFCSKFLTGESKNPQVPFYPTLEGYDHDGNEFSQRGSLTKIPEPDCPCLNGGSCVTRILFGRKRISCRCASGYSGSKCQDSKFIIYIFT